MKEYRILSPSGIVGYGFPEESFAAGVALKPDLIACDFMGSRTSYPKLIERIHECARALRAIGIKEGDPMWMAPAERINIW